MKRKQKRTVSSDEDSDAERNFALFSERQKTDGENQKEPTELREEEEEEERGVGKEDEDVNDEVSDEGEESDEEEGLNKEKAELEEGGELRTREDVQKELSQMSFEDVLKLQNKVGIKMFNKVKHDRNSAETGGKRRRLNKNRPTEVSAKRPVPFLRRVVTAKKPTLRDPRFDDLSGEYKADIFEKTYNFINDIKHREKEVVKKKLKKVHGGKKKEQLQSLMKRMENQERARLSREQERSRELDFKRQQRELANQGQAPRHLKSSDKKKLQLLEKYETLKKSGKLDNFLSKKRKRNAGKDRRKLPPQAASSTAGHH